MTILNSSLLFVSLITCAALARADSFDSVTTGSATSWSESLILTKHFYKSADMDSDPLDRHRAEQMAERKRKMGRYKPESSDTYWTVAYGIMDSMKVPVIAGGTGTATDPWTTKLGTSVTHDFVAGLGSGLGSSTAFGADFHFEFNPAGAYGVQGIDGYVDFKLNPSADDIGSREDDRNQRKFAAPRSRSTRLRTWINYFAHNKQLITRETFYQSGLQGDLIYPMSRDWTFKFSVNRFHYTTDTRAYLSKEEKIAWEGSRPGLAGFMSWLRSYPEWTFGANLYQYPDSYWEWQFGANYTTYPTTGRLGLLGVSGSLFKVVQSEKWRWGGAMDVFAGGEARMGFCASLNLSYLIQ